MMQVCSEVLFAIQAEFAKQGGQHGGKAGGVIGIVIDLAGGGQFVDDFGQVPGEEAGRLGGFQVGGWG